MQADEPALVKADLSIQDAAEYIAERYGRRFSRQAIYGWIADGVDGVRLQTLRIGHTRTTSREWVDEFVARLNAEGSEGEA